MVSSRSLLSAAFFGGLVASVACGGSTTFVPQVYIKASMGPTESAPASCMLAPGTDWLDIGSLDGQTYTPIANNVTDNGATVTVDCRVTPSAGGFDVSVTTSKTGDTTGGSLHIEGQFTATGTQSKIIASFGKASIGNFSANDCTVQFTNQYMGVAAGRVWGVIDCPDASYPSQMRTCDATAEFRFENCDE